MAMQPGDFIAQLNGVRSDYFRINHAFGGIKIPKAGTYMISFSYRPKYFTVSLVMFGLGIRILVGWHHWNQVVNNVP